MWVLLYLSLKSLLRSRVTFLLLVCSVMAAVGFQIPNTANLDGYTAELLRKGLARDSGHIMVNSPNGRAFSGAEAIAVRLREQPHVRGVCSRLLYAASVFLDDRTQSTQIVGFEPEREDAASGFCRRIGSGWCPKPQDGDAVIVGFRLASQLNVHAGDRIKIAIPFERDKQLLVLWHTFQVTGVMDGAGGFRADYQVFVPLDRLRNLFDENDAATTIMVYVDDMMRASDDAHRVMGIVGPGMEVKTWQEEHDFVWNAIAANRAITGISTAMVICAVSIPVVALLYIHVLNERRRIGTLAALGFGRWSLFAIYLFKALIVGITGSVLGSAIGAALCFYFEQTPIFSYAGFVVRPSLTVKTFLLPSLVLLGTTLLAGLLPAIKASRADPSLELRRD